MNFRSYASKLRSQAAAAVNKIPTFDDMAAKDEYIHSEDYNVRGQSQAIKNAGATPMHVNDEPDDSRAPSWSLLDRKQAHTSVIEKDATNEVPLTTEKTQNMLDTSSDAGRNDSVTPSMTSQHEKDYDKRRYSVSSNNSSITILSAVANAMGDNRNASNCNLDEDSGGGRCSDENPIIHTGFEDDDTDSGDSDDDDDDDYDPIMAMIQKSKQPKRKKKPNLRRQQPTGRTETVEQSRRFFNDNRILELEMQEEESKQGEQAIDNQQKTFQLRAPFGGFVLNQMKAQFHRTFRRPSGKISQGENLPPFQRANTSKLKQSLTSEDSYHRADSSSVLCDEDMAALTKLKEQTGGGAWTTVMIIARGYQSYGLIMFTLILALLVYYFQRVADDVS